MSTPASNLPTTGRERLWDQPDSAVSAAGGTGSFLLALAITALAAAGAARAAEPLAVGGRIGTSADGTTLLLHPVTGRANALLTDPFRRLPTESRGAVLQTTTEFQSGAGLPGLVVQDNLPEYWAQPAVWEPFLKGPAAYSGFGRELRFRDWAGRMSTDRRAYALDPGLKDAGTPSSFAPAGPGVLTPALGRAGLTLRWSGVAGRVYRVQHTLTLARPFQDVQTLIAREDGTLAVALPPEGSQGFYRVTEIQL